MTLLPVKEEALKEMVNGNNGCYYDCSCYFVYHIVTAKCKKGNKNDDDCYYSLGKLDNE